MDLIRVSLNFPFNDPPLLNYFYSKCLLPLPGGDEESAGFEA